MNLETINKWLDEEYGCSYTKLEELHDFYFEKYCDLQQENKKLNGAIQTYDILLKSNIKENKRLKDNWNELKKYINEANEDLYWTNNYDDILYVMRELEGSDSNENNNI